MISYRELGEFIKTLSDEQLDYTVTVYDGNTSPCGGVSDGEELLGEFIPVVKMFCTSEKQTNVLDPNHPVLEINSD